jgi:hypothetical protein
MVTIITVGGADKSGSLARILNLLSRNGYGPGGHHFTESAGTKLLTIRLAGNHDKDRLSAELKSLNPDYCVLDVAFEGAQAGSGLIKEMAGQFPDIVQLVQAYGDSFDAKTRDRELFEAGKKIGAFHYAKEWSFGSPLKMPVALRRSLVPALEKFGSVDASDAQIALPDSPFCGAGARCCEFLTGFMQGFLDAGPSTQDTRVQKTGCRATGASHCIYTIEYAV